MVRTPCCEKMGLKKGPWTPAEDRLLIDYIQLHGHGNWRALPKQAGLHRCGKSCRLRWINYLRPDIKRGNFSKEEEDNIIKLHENLGNRWSTIAAMLPGRTDNEIKNVWHTHLKKRLKQNPGKQETKNESALEISENELNTSIDSKPKNFLTHLSLKNSGESPVSPQQSFSENSTVTESSVLKIENQHMAIDEHFIDLKKNLPVINEDIWSEALSSEISYIEEDFPAYTGDPQLQFPISPVFSTEPVHVYSLNTREGMDFWSNAFVKEEYKNYQKFEENFREKAS